jgi:uncharacterized membrane-anchored protein YjiN (DUF445 family)
MTDNLLKEQLLVELLEKEYPDKEISNMFKSQGIQVKGREDYMTLIPRKTNFNGENFREVLEKNINEKIKESQFPNTKVRITHEKSEEMNQVEHRYYLE